MQFLGMGGFARDVISIVILLIFGPKNLPKLGNALGKTVSNLRSGMNAGKKKKDEESDDGTAEESEEPAATQPAEIEGEVESVESAVEESSGAAAVVEDAVVDEDAAGVEAADVPEPVSEEAGSEVNAPEEIPAPKKVRRVVKKKVAEPADAE